MKYTHEDKSLEFEFETAEEVNFFLLLLQKIELPDFEYWCWGKSPRTIRKKKNIIVKQEKHFLKRLTTATIQHLAAISEPECILTCHLTDGDLL